MPTAQHGLKAARWSESYPGLVITSCPQPTTGLLKVLSQLQAVLVASGLACAAEKAPPSPSTQPQVLISPLCATKPALGEWASSSHQSDSPAHPTAAMESTLTTPQSWEEYFAPRNIQENKNKGVPFHQDDVCRLPLALAWAANQPVLVLAMPAGLCGKDTPAWNL